MKKKPTKLELLYKAINSMQKSKTPSKNIPAEKDDGLPEGRTEAKRVNNPLGHTEKNPSVRAKFNYMANNGGVGTKKHFKKGYQ